MSFNFTCIYVFFVYFCMELLFFPYMPKYLFLNIYALVVYFVAYFMSGCVFIIVGANQPSSRLVGNGEICFVGILKSGFTTNICMN